MSRVRSTWIFLALGVVMIGTAFCFDEGGNLATQATIYTANSSLSLSSLQGDLQSVVDGQRWGQSTSQCFYFHGDNPTVHVELAGQADVNFVLIYPDVSGDGFRTAMRGFEVYVEQQLCYRDGDTEPPDQVSNDVAEVLTARCRTPSPGLRVAIRLPGRNRTLRLCEVEVYGTDCDCLEGCYNYDNNMCFAPCAAEKCNRENKALGSPTRSGPLVDYSGPASSVVNGNPGTRFVTQKVTSDVNQQNCILSQDSALVSSTNDYNDTPWWSVDLAEEMSVAAVVIYRRNANQVVRSETYTEIHVDGQLCAEYSLQTLSKEEAYRDRLVVMCDQVVRGLQVNISRVKVSGAAYPPAPLSLCEVQVWGCVPGLYGEDCSQGCGQCRGGRRTCDGLTGECHDGCKAGWYGSGCILQCSQDCLDDGSCHQDTGICLRCPLGLVAPYCEPDYSSTDYSYSYTTTTTTTPPPSPGNEDQRGGGDGDGGNTTVIIGAAVGAAVVVIIIAVIGVILCRRRRGGGGDKPTSQPGGIARNGFGKPDVRPKQSNPYRNAASSSGGPRPPLPLPDRKQDDSTYDVIDHGAEYDTLDEMSAKVRKDSHEYTTPVFKRGQSQISIVSGAYIDVLP